MEALQSYPWPGNVRELRNVIERAMMMSNDKSLVVQAPSLQYSEAPCFLPKLAVVLTPKKVAVYLQIESKIRALFMYGLAANIPYVE